jgi:myo-inositol-1(or 4)-monophosphatase
MHPVVNIALRAARDAAEMVGHAVDRLDRIRVLDDDPVHPATSMAHDVERTLLYHLQKAYPDYSIHSRLSGHVAGRDQDNTWLIDPLHSSGNFIRGLGHCCISLALQNGSRIQHAVLINPMLKEEFTASRGGGAQLNATRLRVGRQERLNHAYVGLAPSLSDREHKQTFLSLQDRLLEGDNQLRISGCPPLDIAYVASGKLDAGWTDETDTVSLAATRLILQESGALFSDENGNPAMQGAESLYGTPRCYKQLLQLRQALGRAPA